MFDVVEKYDSLFDKVFGKSKYLYPFSFKYSDSLIERLEKDFNGVFGDSVYTDKDGNGVIEIECPGFNKDNIKVDLCEGCLTVKGTRGDKDNRKEISKMWNVHRETEVDAVIKDGILTLTLKLPKKKEEPTKIEVK